MGGTPRISDICERLHLSKATVSKALNGYPSVREETRTRVLSCARELGYTPPVHDTDIYRRLTRIGVTVSSVTGNPEAVQVSHAIMNSLSERLGSAHYETVVIPNALLMEQVVPYEQAMRGLNLNCAFITGLKLDDPYALQLRTTSFPTVLWDMSVDNPAVCSVSCDSVEGMRVATAHLIALGHRRIGLICGSLQAQVSLQRRDGYILALADAGIPYDPGLVYYGDFSETSGVLGISALNAKGVTGIVCVSDVVALGTFRAAMSMNLRIPEDLSIVGFDNTNLTEYVTPGLTSIDQRPERIGEVIATAIGNMLQGIPQGDAIVHPTLVVRGSTAAPPARVL